jgi:hypothetical protein
MIDVDKVSEGIHYELIPVEEHENDQAWAIRILRGDFVETVLRYGNISFDGKNECLRFNFMVSYSPEPNLTPDNIPLQMLAGEILEDILEKAYNEGWLVTSDQDSGE